MENELLEQTNTVQAEEVETQTTTEAEEKEAGIELTDTDSKQPVEQVENEEKKVEEAKKLADLLKENPTYQEEFNTILENRLKRERRTITKGYEEKLSKLESTEDILKFGLQKDNIEDINKALLKSYEDQGLEYKPKSDAIPERYLKVIADAEAQEIIDLGIEEIKAEADNLASKGFAKMSEKEKIVFSKLTDVLSQEDRKISLAKIGVKEDILKDKDFIDFANDFNPKTPISKVYEIYTKTHGKTEEKVENPGSMQSKDSKVDKEYYTSEEIDKLSPEDFNNPQIFERVRKSMLKNK